MPVIDLRRVLSEDELDAIAAGREEVLETLVPWLNLLREIRRGAPGPWQEFAACEGRTAVMFPTRGEPVEPGLSLCSVCPVLAECQEWAATQPAPEHGIAGGETARTRAKRRSETKRAA